MLLALPQHGGLLQPPEKSSVYCCGQAKGWLVLRSASARVDQRGHRRACAANSSYKSGRPSRGAVLLAFCGGPAVLDAERSHPAANITGFGDAAWWAATTMTTIGYGDRYPVTATGRLAAVALMVAGIAVLGVVTATLAF